MCLSRIPSYSQVKIKFIYQQNYWNLKSHVHEALMLLNSKPRHTHRQKKTFSHKIWSGEMLFCSLLLPSESWMWLSVEMSAFSAPVFYLNPARTHGVLPAWSKVTCSSTTSPNGRWWTSQGSTSLTSPSTSTKARPWKRRSERPSTPGTSGNSGKFSDVS